MPTVSILSVDPVLAAVLSVVLERAGYRVCEHAPLVLQPSSERIDVLAEGCHVASVTRPFWEHRVLAALADAVEESALAAK